MSVDILTEHVPLEVMDAARRVQIWAEQQGSDFWCIGPVCARRFENVALAARRLLDSREVVANGGLSLVRGDLVVELERTLP